MDDMTPKNIRGLEIQSPHLLKKALTHRSWAYENHCRQNNERLEFLGDAVLSLVVSDYIFERFPRANEGELARLRAGIVNTVALAKTAKRIRLGNYILLGKGEESQGGREKESLLADTFEALIGAVYLEGGLAEARSFILDVHRDILDSVCSGTIDIFDAKGKLQEILQNRSNNLPQYRVVEEIGPDHDKVFTIEVFFEGKMLGRGKGQTKKVAQQNAAKEALENLDTHM